MSHRDMHNLYQNKITILEIKQGNQQRNTRRKTLGAKRAVSLLWIPFRLANVISPFVVLPLMYVCFTVASVQRQNYYFSIQAFGIFSQVDKTVKRKSQGKTVAFSSEITEWLCEQSQQKRFLLVTWRFFGEHN